MTKTIKKSGFTLIELLIVIGLLAALAAVLLPTLMGTREDALAGIDKYNAAGTLRTLRQYEAITGQLPRGMHTGLETGGTAFADLMAGVTAAFSENAKKTDAVTTLSADEAAALNSIGITSLAYGTGDTTKTGDDALGYVDVAEGIGVVTLTDEWTGEDGGGITFNGKGYAALEAEGYTKIINLFITPTTDWSAEGTGWVKGFKVKMDVPGTCPIVDDDFSYYTMFIGIKAEGEATVTVSSTTNSGGTVPTTYLPSQTTAKDPEDLKTTVGNLTYLDGTPTWSSSSNANGDVVTYTATYNYDDSTNDGTITYTITHKIAGTATLLGTSCPEHGVTNP
jgi:prepilin-type N-terminal cleavage/methylation domain-containing protein